MSDEALRRALHDAEAAGDPALWVAAARLARRSSDDPTVGLERAASALDRAFGLAPELAEVVDLRREVLDALEVREHGLVFRYVPAGPFRMGSEDGEPDERPVHEVELDAFWITDVPVAWTRFLALMDWTTVAEWGRPRVEGRGEHTLEVAPGATLTVDLFAVTEGNKVRLQYCEDHTLHATGWHAHFPGEEGRFGRPARAQPERPFSWDAKPMVAVPWEWAVALGARLTHATPGASFRLPTEAEREKAARGGLVGRRYPWGDEPPAGRCDFDRFDAFAIAPSRRYPANGYQLFAMAGGVWEWTSGWYDVQAYASATHDPHGPATGRERVVRGGSWADCADAVRVSFRASRPPSERFGDMSPNLGFRLVRTRRAP